LLFKRASSLPPPWRGVWLERTFDVLLAALLTTHAHREAPGFKDVVAAIMDSPANPAVLFDANPGNWR
jgi:hypothetical protein